jgi:hypothetical protein
MWNLHATQDLKSCGLKSKHKGLKILHTDIIVDWDLTKGRANYKFFVFGLFRRIANPAERYSSL